MYFKSISSVVNSSVFKTFLPIDFSILKRLGIANYQSPLIGNHVCVDSINLCSNSETSELGKEDVTKARSHPQNTQTPNATEENVLHTTKLNTVSKLTKLGLTAEQIADALDLPLDEVIEGME